MRCQWLTKKRRFDIIQDVKLKFDKIKTLKAVECKDGTWMLEGSYYKMKDIYSSSSFDLIAEFNTLEECKMSSDLNLPNVKFHAASYQDWLTHY